VSIAATGCGGDSDPVRPETQLILNDTPANAVARFQAAYEQKRIAEFRGMLTTDFVFTFSSQADPTLVALFPDGWSAEDESLSAQHLFQGFTDGSGHRQPAASSIDLRYSPATPVPDAASSDPAKYTVLLAQFDATIVVPPGPGQTEPTTYRISDNRHRLFFVRGDAAQLDAGQLADSTRWYLYGGATKPASGQRPWRFSRLLWVG
jgi:hypothetical protein